MARPSVRRGGGFSGVRLGWPLKGLSEEGNPAGAGRGRAGLRARSWQLQLFVRPSTQPPNCLLPVLSLPLPLGGRRGKQVSASHSAASSTLGTGRPLTACTSFS